MLTTYIYSYILQDAPFRSQIFKIFFASGGKGALTPLTKILRTFPAAPAAGLAGESMLSPGGQSYHISNSVRLLLSVYLDPRCITEVRQMLKHKENTKNQQILKALLKIKSLTGRMRHASSTAVDARCSL